MDNQKTSFEQYLPQMAPRENIDIFKSFFPDKCKIVQRFVNKNSKNVKYRIHWGRGEEVTAKTYFEKYKKGQF